MTPATILKILNQSTPFDEAQFHVFLQELLGWHDLKLSRDNMPTDLHECVAEFSRLFSSTQSSIVIWILKLKEGSQHAEQDLLNFIASKEEQCLVVIGYPEVEQWKLGALFLQNDVGKYSWINIGNRRSNYTWAHLLMKHHQSEHKTIGSFAKAIEPTALADLLQYRIRHWKRHAIGFLESLSESETAKEQCTTLFIQIFILMIVEQKGWLGISNSERPTEDSLNHSDGWTNVEAWGDGPKNFLLKEWERIQPRGENYWLNVVRPLLEGLSSTKEVSNQYKDIRLPHLNLRILDSLAEIPFDNQLLWDENHGLLSMLYATPIVLSNTEPNSIAHIGESELRSILEGTMSRGNNNEFRGYHTPPDLCKVLSRQSIEANLKSYVSRSDQVSNPYELNKSIEHWFSQHQLTAPIQTHRHLLLQHLQNIKVCDPAVGTGALLVSMLECLTELTCQLDSALQPHKIKFHLLEHVLYGVDVKPVCVDATVISLWLSWVLERTDPKPFLNLECNIICANSLVDEPFTYPLWKQQLQSPQISSQDIDSPFADTILALRSGLMHSIKAYPLSTQPNVRYTEILDMQWKLALLHASQPMEQEEVQRLREEPEKSCIWIWRFPNVFIQEDPGFDIVLCNPPFMSEESNRPLFRDIKSTSKLRERYNGRMDLLYYFVHRMLSITKDNGISALVSNDFWTKSTGGQGLRKHLQAHTHLTHWLHFGDYTGIELASRQHNLLVSFNNAPPSESDETLVCSINFTRDILSWLQAHKRISYVHVPTKSLYHSEQATLQFVDTDAWGDILTKIKEPSIALGKIATLHQGLVTGANQQMGEAINGQKPGLFVLQSDHPYDKDIIEKVTLEEPSILRPLRKNSEIKPYFVESTVERYVLYLHRDVPISETTHPHLMQHLRTEIKRLKGRREVFKGSINWWSLSWPRTPEVFETETIVVPYRSSTFRFALNKQGFMYSSDCTLIIPNSAEVSPLYVLAYLNSTIFECWYRLKGKNKGSLLEFLTSPLQQVPIPMLSPESQSVIVEMVEDLMNLCEHEDSAITTGHKKSLDAIFFRELKLSLKEQRQIYKYVKLFQNVK